MCSKINYFFLFLINKNARLLTYRRAQVFFIKFKKRIKKVVFCRIEKNANLSKCCKTKNLL